MNSTVEQDFLTPEQMEAIKLHDLKESGVLNPSTLSRRERRTILGMAFSDGDNSNKVRATVKKQAKVKAKNKASKKARKKNR